MLSSTLLIKLLTVLTLASHGQAEVITILGNDSWNTVSSSKHRGYGRLDPTLEAFEACGLVKQCFSRHTKKEINDRCLEDRSCDMVFAYGKALGEGPEEDEAVIEVYAVARGWAAIGISDDEAMGDDYVIECVKEGSIVNIYNSWNVDNSTNHRLRGDQSDNHNIRPVKILFYEDKLYCKFYIKAEFSKIDPDGNKHTFNLNKPYFYLMAFSNAVSNKYGEAGNLVVVGSHKVQGAVSENGKEKMISMDRFSPLPRQAKYLRIHGLFMILCWMLLMSISIFISRYLKETLIRIRVCKMELWHFSHALTATLALPCIIASIVFQLWASSGWNNVFRSNFHTYSGIVCLCLFITELLSGICTRKSVEGKINVLNKFHVIVGHLTYALSLLNMALANRVAFGFLACNFRTYIIVWVVIYVVIHFLMTYHKCWGRFILGKGYLSEGVHARGQSVADLRASTLSTGSITPEPTPFVKGKKKRANTKSKHRKSRRNEPETDAHENIETLVIEAPGRYFRIWTLVMFTIVTGVYTYWANRKLLTYPTHCYTFNELKQLELS